MVDNLVYEVRMEKRRANISHTTEAKVSKPKKINIVNEVNGQQCPKCKQGTLLKGKTAYGCNAYKNGCDVVLPFSFKGKKISEKQYLRLLQKGCTVNLKGFENASAENAEGLIRFDDQFQLVFEEKKAKNTSVSDKVHNPMPCPICKKGNVVKGKTAYGCSHHKNGCDFRYTFDTIREKANGKALTSGFVFSLLNESVD